MRTVFFLVCCVGLWVTPSVSAFAQPEVSNARVPQNNAEWKYWLGNMVTLHGYHDHEISAATGTAAEKVARLRKQFKVSRQGFPVNRQRLLVAPFPGGRHPRIGFLDGAIRPQRETKVSIFTPWARHDYVVLDMPEALWSNLGLIYLAHTHIPTYFDRQNERLKPLEWTRHDDGTFEIVRKLPNGISYMALVKPERDHVLMELALTNGTSDTLTDLRVQNCVMLKSASGFNAQTSENKVARPPYALCRSESGTRWIITGWEPLHRIWFNQRCPCLHSDPKFPDCEPGKTVTLRGWLSFFEGTEIESELKRIAGTGWQHRN